MNDKPNYEWPKMPRSNDHDVNQEWHVAINQHADNQRKAGKDDYHWLYDAKTAAQEVPRLALLFDHERNGKLKKVHRQCSHSKLQEVVDNHLTCCLGVECRKCEHLLDLEKAKLTPDQIDWIKAWTCMGHILSNGGDHAGEGFILTTDDRMYWDTVYDHLAQA